MSAIRLARGFTGRDVVVKFAGCYHGHVDALLASAGSGLATFAADLETRPRPAPPACRRRRPPSPWCCPTTTAAAVEAAFAEHGDRIACLVTEAAPGNMGVVPPAPGFNRFLAETCTRHGALFVSDEVMTGFRASREGQWGLDGKAEGWRPDLMTFGKVMGGGFPAAAFGGRADVMAHLSPAGPRLPGRDPLGEPGRDHRRAGHAAAGHRRGLRPPAPRRRRDQGRRRRGVRRRRRPARHPVDRHDVLGVLHRHPGHRLRRRQPPGPPGVRRVLPCHARPRGPPPALGVRGVVPVQRPRRPGCPDDPRRPSRSRGGRRPSRRKLHERDHHRPPAAPRRGAQPRGRALRPSGRLPPLRPRPGDGPGGRRGDQGPRHHPPASPRRSSGPRRPRARWPRLGVSRSPPTSGSSSRRTCSRASASASATARCAARRPGGTCGTRSSRRGASPTRRSWPG